MFYKAKHRYSDVSARKMRPLAQLIRGRNVDEAIEQLRFLPNRGARLIEAVVKSAIGNAEDQGCRNLDDLVVTEVRIDDGPMFKRMQPRARGTAFMIKRRLAHIIVQLTDMDAFETHMATLNPPTPEPAAVPTQAPAVPTQPTPTQPTA